jgi:hypothetical protein
VVKKRLYYYLFAVLSLLYLLLEARGEGDLYIYLQAGGRLHEGLDIYLTKYIDTQYQYYYSVLFAYILQPFYALSYYWVKFFWLLLNYILFLHLAVLFYRASFLQALKPSTKNWVVAVSILFSVRFVHENIHAAQITILIFWSCIMALRYSYKGQALKAAVFLAIGINLKLLPLLLVPYLVYRGYFKTVFYGAVFLGVSYLLPSLLIGHDYNLQLLHSWWSQINPTQARHILDVDERSFHGLSTLLSTLLVEKVPDLYAMPLKRNILDVPYETVSQVLLSARLLLLGFALYFVRSFPFQKAKTAWQFSCEVSYLLLLIPLLFPHQQHYAFLFATPAFGCVAYSLAVSNKNRTKFSTRILYGLVALVYLAGNLKLLLGEFNRYYEHYKILTYGALLLIPLLALSYRAVQKQIATEP